ncbi:MAG: HD domain-containing protein [Planctomycetota bacterium]|nr:HD domain-containing protein [Planctomycetota bacterium]
MNGHNPIKAKINILVADPDELRRRQCCAVLECHFGRVIEVSDGHELLSCAIQHRPDIIVASLQLTGIEGLEAIRRLRQSPAGGETPIIALSVSDDPSQIMAGLDAGADDFLLHTAGPAELALRVEAAMRSIDVRRELWRSHDLRGEHAHALTALLEFSHALATGDNLERILSKTVETAAALAGCRSVEILLPNQERTALQIAKSIGNERRDVVGREVPIGEGVSGRIFQTGGRRLFHVRADAESAAHIHECGFFAQAPAVSIAMQASERTVGVLNASGRINGESFGERALEYLDMISNCAAAVLHDILARNDRDVAMDSIVVALASLTEHRDDATGRHLDRMTGLCLILARELRKDSPYANEIDSAFLENMRLAAPLHDIGKVAIPDRILLKPGKLTPEEIAIMRTHVEFGADTIRSVLERAPDSNFLKMAEKIAFGHHEWVNGNGYPRGVHTTEIPLPARIAALADVYDALVTRRVYKNAFPHAKAKTIILELSGRQFDPVIVDAFVASEDECRALVDELRDREEPGPDERNDPSPAGLYKGPREACHPAR